MSTSGGVGGRRGQPRLLPDRAATALDLANPLVRVSGRCHLGVLILCKTAFLASAGHRHAPRGD